MFNQEIMQEARRIADTDGMGAAAFYLRRAQEVAAQAEAIRQPH